MGLVKYLWPLIILSLAVPSAADEFENKKFNFPADDVRELDIKIELGAGDFQVRVEETTDLARADVEYNPERVRVFGEYEKRGKTGYISFESSLRKHFDVDSKDNNWEIVLSDKYETELNIDIGASESEIDLGGLPLRILDLSIGAAEGHLVFSRQNPIEADEIIIDAGAASFAIDNLGNANFRELSFDGGVGDFELDFSGEYKVKSRAKVSIGLGAAKIIIPKALPVRIDADSNFLSSIDFDNADRDFLDDDYYETDNFRDSSYGLELDISVGLGSVDIVFR